MYEAKSRDRYSRYSPEIYLFTQSSRKKPLRCDELCLVPACCTHVDLVKLKAEEVVERARDALEALVGPFRLRRTVKGALKRGMLMPFPVSVQRGKAAAKLERGQKMREASDSRASRVCSCVMVASCACF